MPEPRRYELAFGPLLADFQPFDFSDPCRGLRFFSTVPMEHIGEPGRYFSAAPTVHGWARRERGGWDISFTTGTNGGGMGTFIESAETKGGLAKVKDAIAAQLESHCKGTFRMAEHDSLVWR